MTKVLKITKTCPRCKSPILFTITKDDLGNNKQSICPGCHTKVAMPVPESWASKFESDRTEFNGSFEEMSLLLETVPNANTAYQCFELTSDYYTIGRKNTGGPEKRPDIEVVTTDKLMSRKHAAITKRGKAGFTIKDLNSKNGIRLNQDKNKMDVEEELYLNDGDTFCLGETWFKVGIAISSDNK